MIRPGLAAGVILIVLALPGCTPKEQAPRMEAVEVTGTLDFAVGAEQLTAELGPSRCLLADWGGEEMLFIRVLTARRAVFEDGTILHPHLLSARLPADLGEEKLEFSAAEPALYQATASRHDASYAGYDYPMIQIVAESIEGTSSTFSCTASKAGEEVEIVCNEARVVPWRAGGEAPTGSFRARFKCAASNGLNRQDARDAKKI